MNEAGPNPGGSWDDLLSALEFTVKRFEGWREERRIRKDQAEAIAAYYQQQGEQWRQAVERKEEPPPLVPAGAAKAAPPLRVYHFWKFLQREIVSQYQAGRLTLPQYHSLEQEAQERMAALERRIRQEGLTPPGWGGAAPRAAAYALEDSAEEYAAPPQRPRPKPREEVPKKPRRNLMEILLDPRSIQWLLGSGGALMVVGLVILLYVNDYLTPPVMAVTMGVANAVVLMSGWGLILKTKYQHTGKAITLLACLIMPLNLWYYHAKGIVTIENHLWVAALFISGFYAVSAYLLKDDLFVYILMGGVTLTGLLILADLPPSPQKFWEIASPATFLVVLGVIAIHVERAFSPNEGPFSRKNFGLAFFWSGHALLASGLLLVLGAQISGDWLWEPVFKEIYTRNWHVDRSPIVTVTALQWLALTLVLAGTYAYIYSDLVVRKVGIYVYVAAVTLLWALILIVRLLEIPLERDVLISLCALLAAIINVVQFAVARDMKFTRAFPILGALLCAVAVISGLYVYFDALNPKLHRLREVGQFEWSYVGAMLLTALSCRLGAHLYRREMPQLSWFYFFTTVGATMVGAVALLTVLGQTTWEQHAPWLMLIPIAYVIAARLYRGRASEQPMLWCAHLATLLMLIASLASAVEGLTPVSGKPLNLVLALFFAEALVFYVLSALFFHHRWDIHLATAMACAALWQLLTFVGVQGEYYTLVFALVGLGLLLAYRFAVVESMAKTAYQSGNTLLTISFAAAILMGLSRLTGKVEWEFVGLCVILGLLSLGAVALVQQSGWRRWYVVSAVGQACLAFLAIQVLSTLEFYEKLEIFCVLAGLVLLVVGHLGWYREQERHSDMVPLALLFGSLLAAVPLAVATIYYRTSVPYDHPPQGKAVFLWLNELGFLAMSVALLVLGLMFRLRATTLVGGFHTVLYFLTLPILIRWGEINTVAIIITVGGGLLFGTGLLLSVYRERLLALPDRIKNREGVFKVLGWR
jgi:hypothetical protein